MFFKAFQKRTHRTIPLPLWNANENVHKIAYISISYKPHCDSYYKAKLVCIMHFSNYPSLSLGFFVASLSRHVRLHCPTSFFGNTSSRHLSSAIHHLDIYRPQHNSTHTLCSTSGGRYSVPFDAAVLRLNTLFNIQRQLHSFATAFIQFYYFLTPTIDIEPKKNKRLSIYDKRLPLNIKFYSLS